MILKIIITDIILLVVTFLALHAAASFFDEFGDYFPIASPVTGCALVALLIIEILTLVACFIAMVWI